MRLRPECKNGDSRPWFDRIRVSHTQVTLPCRKYWPGWQNNCLCLHLCGDM